MTVGAIAPDRAALEASAAMKCSRRGSQPPICDSASDRHIGIHWRVAKESAFLVFAPAQMPIKPCISRNTSVKIKGGNANKTATTSKTKNVGKTRLVTSAGAVALLTVGVNTRALRTTIANNAGVSLPHRDRRHSAACWKH